MEHAIIKAMVPRITFTVILSTGNTHTSQGKGQVYTAKLLYGIYKIEKYDHPNICCLCKIGEKFQFVRIQETTLFTYLGKGKGKG